MRGQVESFVDATQAAGRYAFDAEELRGAVTLSRDGVRAARVPKPIESKSFDGGSVRVSTP